MSSSVRDFQIFGVGASVFKLSGLWSGLTFSKFRGRGWSFQNVGVGASIFAGLIWGFYLTKNLDLWMENFANFELLTGCSFHH